MTEIFIPGQEQAMKMSLEAFRKIARFVLENPMKPGDTFTIEGTDKKKLKIYLTK